MAEQSKILEVKDLRISFKVDSGTVKAVRGISFDLYRGRTLCIVGESGSGKSVTSRAILGILAKNAIVESGEIVYDGKDLLAINEDHFHKIRGSKISMIFQDPLSALNPIMRVGKQLTEPIFLKSKATRREARHNVASINFAIFSTCKKHNLTISKEALEKFRQEQVELAQFSMAHESFEHDLKAFERYSDVVANPAAHPTKTVNKAKAFLASHREKPVEPEHIPTKAMSKEEKEGLIAELKALIETSKKDYDESLAKLMESAKTVLANDLAEGENDFSKLDHDIPSLASEANNCKFGFRDDEDDIIGVFATSLRKYRKSLKTAIKNAEKMAKRETKFKSKGLEVPPLTLKERARLPEKPLSIDEALERLRDLFNHLIHHIQKVMDAPFDSASYANAFCEYFGKQIFTAARKVSQEEAKEQALEIMRQVGIPQPEIRFRQYPFEFSGGMRQRIVIAIALSSRPEILICDEPTTALDVTIQAQILELINRLKDELNLSIIFITHDLGVVANMADDIAVMYAGKIVEYGTVDDIFYDPRHPYTWALLSSMPDLDTKQKLDAIPGTPPNMLLPPKGDAFAARNKYALALDFEEEPPLFEVSPTHSAATWLLLEDAPKAVPPAIVTARIERAMEKRKKKTKEKKEAE